MSAVISTSLGKDSLPEEAVSHAENAAQQDEEVSKLRKLVTRYRKKLVMQVGAVVPSLLVCWLLGYVGLNVFWVLLPSLAIAYGMHQRFFEVVDNASYVAYRWYRKRRAMTVAETSEWLNVLIKEWLTFSDAEFSVAVKRMLDTKLERIVKKVKVLQSISIKSITFGNRPPYFVAMRMLMPNKKSEKPAAASAETSTSASEKPAELAVEVDLEIRCDEFLLHLDVRPKLLNRTFDIPVTSLKVLGRLQLFVTFSHEVPFPHVARVQAAFTEQPVVEFSMPVLGVDLMNVPLLRGAVNSFLGDTIAKLMVDPGRLGLSNQQRKLERQKATAAVNAQPTVRKSALGHLVVTVQLVDTSSTLSATAPPFSVFREACTCVLKLSKQKASMRFGEEDESSSSDSDEEKAARQSRPYHRCAVRRAPNVDALCTSLLLQEASDRLKVRLRHSKFGVLAEWEVLVSERVNGTQLTAHEVLTKETKRAGLVRVVMGLAYSELTPLRERALLFAGADPSNSPVVDDKALRAHLDSGIFGGALFVLLHSAADLLALDRTGTSDPYCVISLNGHRARKTAFHVRTCSPQFNYACELLLSDVRSAQLRFDLYDYDGDVSQKSHSKRVARDDHLGTCCLVLSAAEPLAIRRVCPLSYPAEEDVAEMSELPVNLRRTLPPGADLLLKSAKSAGPSAAPKLGTITVSYIFRPCKSAAGFYTLAKDRNNTGSVYQYSERDREGSPRDSAMQSPPMSAKSEKRKRGFLRKHGRVASDKMNAADLIRSGHGLVEVGVVQARQLLAKDLNGRSDPFCELCIGSEVLFKTKAHHATLQPVWNETITTRLPQNGETLKLTVYDKDAFSKDFLGSVSFTCDAIRAAAQQSGAWYSLTGVRKGQVNLTFRIVYDPQQKSTDSESTLKNDSRADRRLSTASSVRTAASVALRRGDSQSSVTTGGKAANGPDGLQLPLTSSTAAGYCNVKGRVLAVKGLNYRHFLSSKDHDSGAILEQQVGSTERDRLVNSLRDVTVVLKVKLRNRPSENDGGPSRGLESITVCRTEIPFTQACGQVLQAAAAQSEPREVYVDLEFELSNQLSGKTIVYSPASSLVLQLERRKQIIASKAFQFTQLLSVAGSMEPTLLALDEQVAVRVLIQSTRVQNADSSFVTASFRRHRSIRSIKGFFLSKDHRE